MVGLYISFGDWSNALECWRGLRPWDWSYLVLQYLWGWPTPTVIIVDMSIVSTTTTSPPPISAFIKPIWIYCDMKKIGKFNKIKWIKYHVHDWDWKKIRTRLSWASPMIPRGHSRYPAWAAEVSPLLGCCLWYLEQCLSKHYSRKLMKIFLPVQTLE